MKLLITGALKRNDEFFAELKAMGHEITFVQDEGIPLQEQGIDPAQFEGTICNDLFRPTPIASFSNLRYIQLTSAGYDRVPMEYVKAHGIEIHNARGVYSIPMAEFALCGVLQLYKQSRFFAENQRQHRWEKHRGLLELFGKTVCIVGCGSVGTECAKRFSAFGCRVLGVDLFPREDSNYGSMAALCRLDEMLEESDVVVLTLPLTEETHHLMDRERFSHLKPTAILVNIARGGVVDTDALLAALPNLGGAVLDVFEEEPLEEGSPLWEMENVIVTPHNCFVGDGSEGRLFRLFVENFRGKVYGNNQSERDN